MARPLKHWTNHNMERASQEFCDFGFPRANQYGLNIQDLAVLFPEIIDMAAVWFNFVYSFDREIFPNLTDSYSISYPIIDRIM